MSHQPMFPSPYMSSIDAENPSGNIFKCLINPRDVVKGYSLIITDNTTGKKLVEISGGLNEDNTQYKTINGDNVAVNQDDTVLPLYGTSNDDDSWLKVLVPHTYIPSSGGDEKTISLTNGVSSDNEYSWHMILRSGKDELINTSTTVVRLVSLDFITFYDLSMLPTGINSMRLITSTNNYKTSSSTWVNGIIDGHPCVLTAESPPYNFYRYFYESHSTGKTFAKAECYVDGVCQTTLVQDAMGIRDNGIYIDETDTPISTTEYLGFNYGKYSADDVYLIECLNNGVITTHEPIFFNDNKLWFTYDNYLLFNCPNPYTATHKLYSGGTPTPDYYFSCGKRPTVTFQDVPDVINSNSIKVVPVISGKTYSIVSYTYNLYLGGEIIYTTGDIYSANIQPFQYANLISENNYHLECIVNDVDGNSIIGEVDFGVQYTNSRTSIAPTAEYNTEKNCVELDFSKINVLMGSLSNGQAAYSEYVGDNGTVSALQLSSGQNLIYTGDDKYAPLNLDKTSFAMVWHGAENYKNGNVLFKISGDSEDDIGAKIDYYDGYFRYCNSPEKVLPGEIGLGIEINRYYDTYKDEFCSVLDIVIPTAGYKSKKNSGYVKSVQNNTVTLYSTEELGGGYSTDMSDFVTGNYIAYDNKFYKITNGYKTSSWNWKIEIEASPAQLSAYDVLSKDTDKGIIVAYDISAPAKLYDSLNLTDDCVLFSNDMMSKYWWLVVVNYDESINDRYTGHWKFAFKKIKKYFETEVSDGV